MASRITSLLLKYYQLIKLVCNIPKAVHEIGEDTRTIK